MFAAASPVMPAKAGIHASEVKRTGLTWTPAFAGVTGRDGAGRNDIPRPNRAYSITTVTARRFCAQAASSEPKAIGRSLP